jgi:hypothetical protein
MENTKNRLVSLYQTEKMQHSSITCVESTEHKKSEKRPARLLKHKTF